jgi:hypothetical protein
MATWLKQSTVVEIAIGPFLDSADGNTVESALTITQPDIRLKKNGGAWAQKSAAQTLTHEENGWYEIALSTTDTDTLGILIVAVHESGALPVWREFNVVPANVYDSLFSTDLLQVDLTQWLGVAPLALASQLVQTQVNSISAGIVSAASLSTDSGLKPIRSGTCEAASTSSTVALDSGASATTDFYKGTRIYLVSGTGVGQSRLCTAYNGATKVATIEPNWITNPGNGTTTFAIRDDGYAPGIGTGGVAATSFAAGAINAAATNADFLAEINAEVDTALADYDAPTFAELDARTDAIEADTQDIQARLPAALVSGRIDASVGAMATDVLTASAVAADAIGASELATDAVQEIADAILDRANGVETGVTLRQVLRGVAAALLGKASGLATTTAVFRDVNDTKDRITATVDADGNRSAVVTDLT